MPALPTTPINSSIENVVEDTLAALFLAALGQSSTTAKFDPRLNAAYRVGEVTAGSYLFEDDLNSGPLMRLAVTDRSFDEQEIGGGPDTSDSLFSLNVRIGGMSATYPTIREAKGAARDLGNVVGLMMLELDLSTLQTTLVGRGGKHTRQSVVMVTPGTKTRWGIDRTGTTNSIKYAAWFDQSWTLKCETLNLS